MLLELLDNKRLELEGEVNLGGELGEGAESSRRQWPTGAGSLRKSHVSNDASKFMQSKTGRQDALERQQLSRQYRAASRQRR